MKNEMDGFGIVYPKLLDNSTFIWCGKQIIDFDLINKKLSSALIQEKITNDEYQEYLHQLNCLGTQLQDFYRTCVYPLKLLDNGGFDDEE